jgi:transposase-like protein
MMLKGRHFDCSVILLCVRWYLAYGLSLRNLEEMMAERGISVEYATVYRWVIRYSSELLEQFNRQAGGDWQAAHRRNLHQGPRPLDVCGRPVECKGNQYR